MSNLKKDEQPNIYIGSRTNTAEADEKARETLSLKYANRHGLIAGATGTGKTVTLQGLAESFSNEGVPVFLSDIKGDLSGMAHDSAMEDFLVKRANIIGMNDEGQQGYQPQKFPAVFWDVFGEQGHPVRTTISEMGPILLARILELNDTQEGVLNITFRIADEEGLLLLDLKDLRSMLISVGERAKEISLQYGNISTASIGAIQRSILRLEDQGGNDFFGEPALDLNDFMRVDQDGRGQVNILAADKLMNSPRLYATFMLWLLSELFEELPEVGDPEKPKLVFFFDEAHLLFTNAPRSLLEKVEQVVKLIRSKGVGIYFVTQNPADIPEGVLAQLGNRIQHALRSFTAKQRKSIKLAAQTYRENPEFEVASAITELGVGEALVSTLEKKGQPSIVQRTLIRPPYSKLGPISDSERAALIEANQMHKKYGDPIDRESAYEILKTRGERAAEAAKKAQEEEDRLEAEEEKQKAAEKARKAAEKEAKRNAPRRSNRQTPGEAFISSMARKIGNQLGGTLIRGILGALKR